MADQYSIALQNALNQKNSSMANANNQQAGVNNTYQDLMDTLNKRKLDATNLKNTQLATGEMQFNNQRDQSVANINGAMSNDKDWLANHGISNSNENADQMGRLQTKLGNSLSGINANKTTYNNGNENSFNSSMGDIAIANTAGTRQRDTSNVGIQNTINDINRVYNENAQNINRQQQAAAISQARAAASRASSAKKSKAAADQAAAVQKANNYQDAIQSALDSQNLAKWVQDNVGTMTDNLTPAQKASMMPGGATYHHILTGV